MSCLCWGAQSRDHQQGVLPAESASGAAQELLPIHTGPAPAWKFTTTSSSGPRVVFWTKSGVGLSQIQHFCSLVTLLCSINSGMRVAPYCSATEVAGQPHQQAAPSASPASYTFNFPQKHSFHGQHKGCSHVSLRHVYTPLISLKKVLIS